MERLGAPPGERYHQNIEPNQIGHQMTVNRRRRGGRDQPVGLVVKTEMSRRGDHSLQHQHGREYAAAESRFDQLARHVGWQLAAIFGHAGQLAGPGRHKTWSVRTAGPESSTTFAAFGDSSGALDCNRGW